MAAGGVEEFLAGVAASLNPQAVALSGELVQRMLAGIPELTGDERIVSLLTASTAENVASILHVLQLGLDQDRMEAPAAAMEYARRLAQRGTAISALLRAYRLGQAGFQHRMIQEFARATTDPEMISAASLQLTTATFGYIDRVAEQVVVAYQQERDRWLQNRVAMRSARVLSVLAADGVDIAEAENTLGYRLRQTHLGVVAWTDDSARGPDRLVRLERLVTDLAERAGCERAPLFIPHDESTMWAWLPGGRTRLLMEPQTEKPPATVDETSWIAVGQPAAGLEGFRLTHRQALQAQMVALAATPAQRTRVMSFEQVGPIALMCADIDAVRAWVHDTLGALAIDDEPHARLRETLRVFLATGGSFTATAEQLTLHKNTVQYRVRKAEEARGRSLQEGRLDVEVALLACRWLGTAVLQPRPAGR